MNHLRSCKTEVESGGELLVFRTWLWHADHGGGYLTLSVRGEGGHLEQVGGVRSQLIDPHRYGHAPGRCRGHGGEGYGRGGRRHLQWAESCSGQNISRILGKNGGHQAAKTRRTRVRKRAKTDVCVTYVAVGQRDGHDVLRVDLQRADSLARTSVLRLDGKLCDEPVDAAWEEPGHHDKGVVLSKRRQVGHKSRGWKERGFEWRPHRDIGGRGRHRCGSPIPTRLSCLYIQGFTKGSNSSRRYRCDLQDREDPPSEPGAGNGQKNNRWHIKHDFLNTGCGFFFFLLNAPPQ